MGDVDVVDGRVLVPDLHEAGPVVGHVHEVVLSHKQWEPHDRGLVEHRIKRLVILLVKV